MLHYATFELKNDIELVKLAIKQDSNAIKYASFELKNKKEIYLEAIKHNYDILH